MLSLEITMLKTKKISGCFMTMFLLFGIREQLMFTAKTDVYCTVIYCNIKYICDYFSQLFIKVRV